jgi:hypothetical protein
VILFLSPKQTLMSEVALLEKDKAALYELGDEEFTEAAREFRVHGTAAFTAFAGASARSAVWSPFEPLAYGVGSFVGSAVLGVSNLLGDGDSFSLTHSRETTRDPNTLSLDATPFRDVLHYVRRNSRPDYSNVFYQTQSIKDLNKLKNLAAQIMAAVVVAGPTEAVVQMLLYKNVTAIVKSIDVSDVRKEVVMETVDHSVEVNKETGAVVIGSFEFKFRGEVWANCCWSGQEVKVSVEVKVWNFPSVDEVRQEFMRLRNK